MSQYFKQTFPLLFLTVALLGLAGFAYEKFSEYKNTALIEAMFKEVGEGMDASKIEKYFAPDFELTSNNVHMDYKTFLEYHQQVPQHRKSLVIQKPIRDLVAANDKVAGDIKVVLTDKKDVRREIEVIFIAQFRGSKIFRLYELTFPDWQEKAASASLETRLSPPQTTE